MSWTLVTVVKIIKNTTLLSESCNQDGIYIFYKHPPPPLQPTKVVVHNRVMLLNL